MRKTFKLETEGAPMTVQHAVKEDIELWMRLAKTVGGIFPGLGTERGLREHRRAALNSINKHEALCVKINGEIAGGLIYDKSTNEICFLAVLPENRRMGIASALLESAIASLDGGRDITVVTFKEGDENAEAARALYKRFAFSVGEIVNLFGATCQRLILRR